MNSWLDHAQWSHAAKASFAAIVAALLTVWCAPMAQAHDSVLSSNPADGAVLEEFPERVELVFSGDPKPNFNTIAISDADKREVLFTSEPELENNLISLDLPADLSPGPGNYIVGFQITSSDGHSTRGKVSFSVGDVNAPGGGTSAQQSGTSASASTAQGIPGWAIGLGIGLVVLIVGVGVAVAVMNRKVNVNHED